uniref:SXP/RAL-2 family protein Ani s 5-like cation-binding domain-containing protein n=1 Tax=Graphocephala atropunctata TaxID=36148 RepID=A0A1B6MI50_9HEMI
MMKGSCLTILFFFAIVSLIESQEYYEDDTYSSITELEEKRFFRNTVNSEIKDLQSMIYDATEKIRLLARDNFNGIYNRAINVLNGVLDALSKRLQNLTSSYR